MNAEGRLLILAALALVIIGAGLLIHAIRFRYYVDVDDTITDAQRTVIREQLRNHTDEEGGE